MYVSMCTHHHHHCHYHCHYLVRGILAWAASFRVWAGHCQVQAGPGELPGAQGDLRGDQPQAQAGAGADRGNILQHYVE